MWGKNLAKQQGGELRRELVPLSVFTALILTRHKEHYDLLEKAPLKKHCARGTNGKQTMILRARIIIVLTRTLRSIKIKVHKQCFAMLFTARLPV